MNKEKIKDMLDDVRTYLCTEYKTVTQEDRLQHVLSILGVKKVDKEEETLVKEYSCSEELKEIKRKYKSSWSAEEDAYLGELIDEKYDEFNNKTKFYRMVNELFSEKGYQRSIHAISTRASVLGLLNRKKLEVKPEVVPEREKEESIESVKDEVSFFNIKNYDFVNRFVKFLNYYVDNSGSLMPVEKVLDVKSIMDVDTYVNRCAQAYAHLLINTKDVYNFEAFTRIEGHNFKDWKVTPMRNAFDPAVFSLLIQPKTKKSLRAFTDLKLNHEITSLKKVNLVDFNAFTIEKLIYFLHASGCVVFKPQTSNTKNFFSIKSVFLKKEGGRMRLLLSFVRFKMLANSKEKKGEGFIYFEKHSSNKDKEGVEDG